MVLITCLINSQYFFIKFFGVFSASGKWLQKPSLTIVQNNHLSKLKQNFKKFRWSWFAAKYFVFNYFPGWLFQTPENNSYWKCYNEFEWRRKSYEVSLLIVIQVLPDFCRFYSFNGFKLLNIFTKSPILNVWRIQNSHLTLINEKQL